MNREIIRLALPSIASNITVPLLGLCDVTIMGHVGGAASIAAIAVGSMIFNVMYWLFGFLRMGTSGITAQAVGRLGVSSEDEGEEGYSEPSSLPPLASQPSPQQILRSSLAMAFALGIAIVVIQLPLQWLTFWLMQVPDDVRGLCTQYYYICVWGAPAMLGLYSLTGWFIGMQDTRTPMLIAIGQNVLNIGLSLFLVVVLGMGIAGVALGTMVSQWAALLAAIVAKGRTLSGKTYNQGESTLPGGKKSAPGELPVRSGRTPSPLRADCLKGSAILRLWRNHFRIYLDIFLRTLCLVAVNLWFTSSGAAQGALTLAANTLLMQFFMFFSYVMDGFAFAGEALAGKSYGRGDMVSLRRVVVLLMRWGVGVALLFTTAYWLGGGQVLRLLTSDTCVVAAAEGYLPWAVAIPAAGMAAFVWDGIFIGITATRGMLWSCFVAAAVFFTLQQLLAPAMGNHALWLAMLAYLAMRGLIQTLLYCRTNKVKAFRHIIVPSSTK